MITVGLFLTYDYEINTWHNSGTLEKEIKIYKAISDSYPVKFKIFTYGDNKELKFQNDVNDYEIIPLYSKITKSQNKLIRFIKSLFIPIYLKKELEDVSIVQQHQLMGIWVTLLVKFLYKKKLYLRTGYDMYLFSKQENKIYIKKYFLYIWTYLGLKFSDIYSVTNLSDKSFLLKTFNIKNTLKIRYRPNWVEKKEKIEFSKRNVNSFLSVGRLENQKNYKYLLKEFSKLSSNFRLDIVGTGSDLDSLKKFSLEKDLNVNFLGQIENSKLIDLYDNYQFYISTSLFEGNPKTILEALNSGCIVFASDIPNHRELIEDGVSGYLYELKNDCLKNKIDSVLRRAINLSEISNVSSTRIEVTNSIQKIAKNYSEDYLELTNIS